MRLRQHAMHGKVERGARCGVGSHSSTMLRQCWFCLQQLDICYV